ncbi:hypothetical protein FF100_21295 [Methylobacterium terricola]|uniref:Uncharacterized protein n=1 Tax=Methylobacterium terricola TaxID=2583531 RepID=A0A5C4LCH0_9HYPH|nr:hypothetical protein [Methylobacterium terricola]TNC10700.1 hypothetical protein FF100_21295 [Methylobacterium terricola]
MSGTNSSFTEANVPTRSFGSDNDSVLDGVARGLEAMFPPIYQFVSRDDDPEVVQEDREHPDTEWQASTTGV